MLNVLLIAMLFYVICYSQVDKTLFNSIVHIAVIPLLESSTLHLMAVTQVMSGCGFVLFTIIYPVLNLIMFHFL